ncbi:rhodanese-like domain-containing protein [Tsukamurella sp. 1534]|uniref:rhodanese-like domain-containing protein n=1 Tax=Tsukamurella sp. 1534 TaxID=1151061 RepID=UPI0002FCDD1E|nr:rhodanese-like domain-containing protein [Tsukamurella sp. 1534]
MHPVHYTPADDAIVVDLRDQSDRSRDGILTGAIALDAAAVAARLVPGLPTSLAAAAADTRWVLVSNNGATASAIATRLRDRGVRATSVDGGFRALALGVAPGGAARPESAAYRRAVAAFAAHEA